MDETWEFVKRRADDAERRFVAEASRVVDHAAWLLQVPDDVLRRGVLADAVADARQARECWEQAVSALARLSSEQTAGLFEAVQ